MTWQLNNLQLPARHSMKSFTDLCTGRVYPGKGKKAAASSGISRGKHDVDFAGIAVTALGHCHPALVEALKTEAKPCTPATSLPTNRALRLGRKIIDATFAERVLIYELRDRSHETAFKRRATMLPTPQPGTKPKSSLSITFPRSFTVYRFRWRPAAKYSDGFGPKPADIIHVPFNDLACGESGDG